jgi:tetratricopeptide (TPR) repeat protein
MPDILSMKKYSLLLLLLPLRLWAQPDFPPLSPSGYLSQQIGDTQIEIWYDRPASRGREIFGELVPWGEVWRTGAGPCTKIRFDQPVEVGGQAVPAGIYALATIPQPDQWMVILHRDTSLYGAYGYDPAQDVARFWVPVGRSERFYEALTFDLDVVPNDARFYLSWGHLQLSFPIKTGTDADYLAYLRDEVYPSSDPEALVLAAEYLLMQQQHYLQALALTRRALKVDPQSEFAYNIKASLETRLGYHSAAKATVEAAIEMVKEKDFPNERERALTLKSWRERLGGLPE